MSLHNETLRKFQLSAISSVQISSHTLQHVRCSPIMRDFTLQPTPSTYSSSQLSFSHPWLLLISHYPKRHAKLHYVSGMNCLRNSLNVRVVPEQPSIQDYLPKTPLSQFFR